MSKLNNLDLLNNKFKYDINILEKNIQHLNKKILISTQKLTAKFCIMYLFDMDIKSGNENSYLFDVNYILHLFSFKTPILLGKKIRKNVKSIVGISPTMVLLFHLPCFYLKM